MYTFLCKCGSSKKYNSNVLVPLFCECGDEMSLSEVVGFTSYWYRTPSDGEIQPAPETPKGYVAVQYRDEGYQAGEYWAILPANFTMESAIALFESESHMNELVEVNFQRVPIQW